MCIVRACPVVRWSADTMAQYRREQRTRDLISRRQNMNVSSSTSTGDLVGDASAGTVDKVESVMRRGRQRSIQPPLSPDPRSTTKRARPNTPSDGAQGMIHQTIRKLNMWNLFANFVR